MFRLFQSQIKNIVIVKNKFQYSTIKERIDDKRQTALLGGGLKKIQKQHEKVGFFKFFNILILGKIYSKRKN